MPAKSKRLSLRTPFLVAAIGAAVCAVAWLSWGIYLYWNDPKLVNFLAAWIPFVISILLAFVPESEMTRRKKLWWRGSVIGVGFIWSVVLWHQQVITDDVFRKDQARIVSEAVTKSNAHSDQQFGTIRGDVKDVKTDLEEEINATISKSTSSLNESIGKAAPKPPEFAHLKFSVFKDKIRIDEIPILTANRPKDKDGNIAVEVFFMNTSDVSADALDIWITVCDACAFASEPIQFQKIPGMDEHERHRFIPVLNSGTAFEKIMVNVKLLDPTLPWFDVAFQYACKSCGKPEDKQTVRISTSTNPADDPDHVIPSS